jgi:Tol biopolymer transport system component
MGGESFPAPGGAARVARMPISLPKSKLIPILLALVVAMAVPAAAHATLTYTKGFNKPKVYVAENSGKGARSIGPGSNSRISPNGEWIVYERRTGENAEMRLYSVESGKSERLLNPWRESFVLAWSPDSTMIAATTGGGLNSPGSLYVIDVESGKRTKVATGYVNGVSFSPRSDEMVYGISQSQNIPSKSDIYRYAIVGGTSTPLSSDHNALDPLWSATGQIAFVRQLGAKSRKYQPANQLFVMNDEGQRISQLSHTKVDPLASGLGPVQWSANGKRLLAEFGGQDQSYAVAVNAVTGAEKALTSDPESGFQGAALSADGRTVLGTTGLNFGGDSKPSVVTVPFSGGPQKVLVVGGYNPTWSE